MRLERLLIDLREVLVHTVTILLGSDNANMRASSRIPAPRERYVDVHHRKSFYLQRNYAAQFMSAAVPVGAGMHMLIENMKEKSLKFSIDCVLLVE